MKREGLLLLTCLLFTLIGFGCNKEDDPFLLIEQKTQQLTFDSNGGSLSIPVNSNFAFNTSLSQPVNWCETTIVGQSVKVTVDRLEEGKNRSIDLIISSKGKAIVVQINQEAITMEEIISPIILTNEISTFSFEIIASAPVEFDYPDWIIGKDIEWKKGTKRYIFEANPYFGDEASRTGILTVKSKDPSVGFKSSLTISQTFHASEAILKIHELWNSSPFVIDSNRRNLFAKMEEYSNLLPHHTFQSYLNASATVAEEMEKANPILSVYRHAFDFVLSQIKSETPEDGSTMIWLLYNMGFIVKTPSTCFGIDVNHRLAEQLEPYLDFICVTHDHGDHKSIELMNAMHKAGKPVLSNFYTTSKDYHSTNAGKYSIGNTSIRTNITDHDATLKNFTTVFRIDAGNDSGNFTLLHCGDSSFDPNQYTNVDGGSPSLLILRSGAKIENNIIGKGSGQVDPKNVFLSHLIELRHKISESPMRYTIMGTLEKIPNISNNNTFVPFWGERFIWKNGELHQ